jgi:hypothetical protein
MHVCCIARQKDAPLAIRRRLPGVVRKTGSPAQAVYAVVGPVGGDECLADVLQGGLAGVLDLAFGQDDPNPISALGRADPTAGRRPNSGFSTISTSAMSQLVDGSHPANSISAAFRITLRPPSHPTR